MMSALHFPRSIGHNLCTPLCLRMDALPRLSRGENSNDTQGDCLMMYVAYGNPNCWLHRALGWFSVSGDCLQRPFGVWCVVWQKICRNKAPTTVIQFSPAEPFVSKV